MRLKMHGIHSIYSAAEFGHLLFMCIAADSFWQDSALPVPEKQDWGIQATAEKTGKPNIHLFGRP